ncbi:Polypeptide N-acetylgalactosaminyltransferase-like 6 [Channa argus]|uniref:Polypeptide N-acetylgalactosaminyltransferase-like 6 n=1 Tax=Channa argus TaxID=215402 RepID=A0A6G1QSS3_CHAAH|nr:Polypeptide N-acetylgalactosaminyltransferase-like 6 [Channa argus]
MSNVQVMPATGQKRRPGEPKHIIHTSGEGKRQSMIIHPSALPPSHKDFDAHLAVCKRSSTLEDKQCETSFTAKNSLKTCNGSGLQSLPGSGGRRYTKLRTVTQEPLAELIQKGPGRDIPDKQLPKRHCASVIGAVNGKPTAHHCLINIPARFCFSFRDNMKDFQIQLKLNSDSKVRQRAAPTSFDSVRQSVTLNAVSTWTRRFPSPLLLRSLSPGDMRRKEKRLLQVAGLLIAALLFVPNVGLWSLYRDRVLDNSPDRVDAPGGVALIQHQGQRLSSSAPRRAPGLTERKACWDKAWTRTVQFVRCVMNFYGVLKQVIVRVTAVRGAVETLSSRKLLPVQIVSSKVCLAAKRHCSASNRRFADVSSGFISAQL